MSITENRRRTLAALRGLMPEGFKWAFDEIYKKTSCGTVGCAMGMMEALGIVEIAHTGSCANALRIPKSVAYSIFLPRTDHAGSCEQTYLGFPYEDVTPSMVADALERAFAEHSVRKAKAAEAKAAEAE